MVCDFHNLHGPIFEYSFVTALQYKYEQICSLYECKNLHEKSSDKMIFGGGIPLPYDSTTVCIVSLCVNINFIEI